MARVTYTGRDGNEHDCRLTEHRTIRIGREPDNDIVLRDPKTSRLHAEIVFDKGFYVLRDLDSANGSFVNGQRIRVAPLTDNAEIRLGNSTLRFSEDLPEMPAETVAARFRHEGATSPPMSLDPTAEVPITAPPEPAAHIQEPAHGGHVSSSAAPAPPEPPTRSRISRPTAPPSRAPRSESTPSPPPPQTELRHSTDSGAPEHRKPSLDNTRLLIDDIDTDFDQTAIRNELDQPIAWFLSNRSAVAFLATFMATMLTISGLAVTLFLVYERAWLPAVTAILITICFALMVGAAVPRRVIPVWSDVSRSERLLTVRQERGVGLPSIRFLVEDSQGALLATLERNVISAGRRTWVIRDPESRQEMLRATETSLLKSYLGRVLGRSLRPLRARYILSSGHRHVGTLDCSDTRAGRVVLDRIDAQQTIDSRITVGAALAIANVDG